MYLLLEQTYLKIKQLFEDSPLLTDHFTNKIKQNIGILHHGYLWGACKEAQALLKRTNLEEVRDKDLFSIIMNIYNKRNDRHQAHCSLLRCFEHALRSTMAIRVADTLNQTKDDWFLKKPDTQESDIQRLQTYLIKKIDKIIDCKNKKYILSPLIKEKMTTFEVFDLFSLGDLEYILKKFYFCFESLFKETKTYNHQLLPSYGTKKHAINTISRIREARNSLYHNNPTHIKFQYDTEILLLRLGYDFKEAGNIQELQPLLAFKFHKSNHS